MQRTAAASIAIVIISGIYLLTIIEGQMFRDYHGLDVVQRKEMLQASGSQASGSIDIPAISTYYRCSQCKNGR